MRKRLMGVRLASVAPGLFMGLLLAATVEAQTLAIRNVTLIDGTGAAAQPNATVIVNSDRFSAVGSAGTAIPANATIIDGSGKYLIPGLMDVHVHVPGGVVRNSKGEQVRPEDREEGVSVLHSFLFSGITTVYDASNNADYIFGLREEERAGTLLSPRIFATGSAVTFPGSWGAGANSTLIERWPEGQAGLDRNFARDPDLQKITYENFGTGANPWVPSFPDDVITSIIQHAKAKGVRTTIHISDEEHARIALAAGVDTLAHPVVVGRMSQDFVDMMVEKNIIVASTLAVFDNIVRIVDEPEFLNDSLFRAVYTEEQIEEMQTKAGPRYASIGWDSWFKTTLKYSMENVKHLHEAGVVIALGTDRTIGPLTHRELELYVDAGVSPLDAITMGTLNAAKYLDREDELGTIEPGKLADMVLLNANPLDDIGNTQKISRVFKGGVEIDRDALLIPKNQH